MLKFFRRIRRNVTKQGNLKKYLLYAIGEILLVMIGILLALQVNNWNGKKQLKNLETSTLLEVSDALGSDLSQLEDLLSINYRSKSNLDSIISYLDKEIDYHPNMNKMWASGFLRAVIKFNLSPFDLLKSRGFDIIKDAELRKQIQFHYDISIPYYLTYIDRNYATLNAFRNQYRSHLKTQTLKDLTIASSPINIESMRNDIRIMSGLKEARYYRARSIKELLVLKQSTENLSAKIQDYLIQD